MSVLANVPRVLDGDKPHVVLDFETTSNTPTTARIVQMAFVRHQKGHDRRELVKVLNPGEPIDPAASEVHGFTDDDVKDCDRFNVVTAERILDFCDGCDLIGYNHITFDIPVLLAEFERIGMTFPMEGRRLIDAKRIFYKLERRTLTDAARKYAGIDLELDDLAHDALNDAYATSAVLAGQCIELGRRNHPEGTVPTVRIDFDYLHEMCNEGREDYLTFDGKIQWNENNEAIITFGKWKGTRLCDVDAGYFKWACGQDFPADVKKIFLRARNGIFPRRE